ncbi:MAG: hypothetical protein A7316_04520 [Candidatus Altiarchaeales archaeon WOR_SM1_86-2]|nr:MAG: hypothetical protein A7316_04520 [Candidatus Altiarchaeales archaeon WOR_SM1_86-2]ODS37850.1 MAG: hypothetical protein A7315_03575 [Candidatus Altiarchaeales archaeon WOR_SM1_79]
MKMLFGLIAKRPIDIEFSMVLKNSWGVAGCDEDWSVFENLKFNDIKRLHGRIFIAYTSDPGEKGFGILRQKNWVFVYEVKDGFRKPFMVSDKANDDYLGEKIGGGNLFKVAVENVESALKKKREKSESMRCLSGVCDGMKVIELHASFKDLSYVFSDSKRLFAADKNKETEVDIMDSWNEDTEEFELDDEEMTDKEFFTMPAGLYYLFREHPGHNPIEYVSGSGLRIVSDDRKTNAVLVSTERFKEFPDEEWFPLDNETRVFHEDGVAGTGL